MTMVLRFGRGAVALLAGLAMLGLGCSESSSPTAPLAAEPQMQAVPTSGNATADETEDLEIREFFGQCG